MRRAERDISEFLGLAKGVLADGQVSGDEAGLIAQWLIQHPDARDQWPLNQLVIRIQAIFADGFVDPDEQHELADLLQAIVGGTGGIVAGEDAATELPLSVPPPNIVWTGSVFVFTGKFACGTRSQCEGRVIALGGMCEADVTHRTTCLVIGTFGSRDWIHTSFGRKIEKAVEYRDGGGSPWIVGENYWVKCLEAAG
jgi:hypothetical protein